MKIGQTVSEPAFEDQVATVLRVEAELEGRWVVQKCRFGIWGGIQINPIMPEDPVDQKWVPFTAQHTYETSGEAVDEMERLLAIGADVPMRVRPVQKDINATYLFPRKGSEKRVFGDDAITWGELKRRFAREICASVESAEASSSLAALLHPFSET